MANYIKDTQKYWQERTQHRVALDRKRDGASSLEKRKMEERISSDVRFMRTGKIISTKETL